MPHVFFNEKNIVTATTKQILVIRNIPYGITVKQNKTKNQYYCRRFFSGRISRWMTQTQTDNEKVFVDRKQLRIITTIHTTNNMGLSILNIIKVSFFSKQYIRKFSSSIHESFSCGLRGILLFQTLCFSLSFNGPLFFPFSCKLSRVYFVPMHS